MAVKMKEKPETVSTRKSSMFLEFFQRLVKSWSAKIGLFLMLFIILACVVGPYLTGYDLNWQDQSLMRAGPSWDHILGCDTLGRDMLTRLLYGGRYSLMMGIMALGSICLRTTIFSRWPLARAVVTKSARMTSSIALRLWRALMAMPPKLPQMMGKIKLDQ